jgi:pimeloyl-ACP methyl ester carboxylesterase
MPDSIVVRFGTPPEFPETDLDRGAFQDARHEEFPFENMRLQGYSLGEGKNVLLVHGWGSRASHLALIARTLAKSGFHVVAFDGPAHGNSHMRGRPNQSNMFEFCRAISAVGQNLSPIHGVIGHSFGAATAAFTVSGFKRMRDFQLSTERLVLISPPSGVDRMIEHFCRRTGEEARITELTKGLEKEFDFSIPEYSVLNAVRSIQTELLIVHDEEDEDIPIKDALALKQARPDAKWVSTRGSGHQRILGNRIMIRAVKDFISAP